MSIKLSQYNILNMLLTGIVFCVGVSTLYVTTLIKLIVDENVTHLGVVPEIILLICFLAVSYEIGLILNRAGSVLLELSLKKIMRLPFSDYVLYLKVSEKKPILHILSREYALSRTSILEFLILTVWSACLNKWFLMFFYFLCALIFYFSCKKHSQRITDIVNAFNQK